MKNIYLIETNKPSRICFRNYYFINKDNITEYSNVQFQNIYIISDKEIKNSDWVLFTLNDVTEIIKVTTIVNNAFDSKEGFGYGLEYCKKIILTDNPDLIKDGIQAIDDKFLEWFVKSTSCRYVKTTWHTTSIDKRVYNIVIPQEESKILAELDAYYRNGIGKKEDEDLRIKFPANIEGSEEFNKANEQETLEEAAYQDCKKSGFNNTSYAGHCMQSFINGVKWQAKKIYTYEELCVIIDKTLIEYSDKVLNDIPEWVEQFKKK